MTVRLILLAALVAVVNLIGAHPSQAADVNQSSAPQRVWTQLGPNGISEVRAITNSSVCPMLQWRERNKGSQSEHRQRLAVRAQPSANFANRVCEGVLPRRTVQASVGKKELALPKANPKRIVVIGDTGCRLADDEVQACNNPNQWPFAQIANQVSRKKPDLIIHTGDIHYREVPCPPGFLGCAGSPFGYNAAANNADFFTPTKRLLDVAPWVFIRGNHELCERNGEAWFRYWDARPLRNCQEYTRPYAVPIGGGEQLVLFDTAPLSEEAKVTSYRRQISRLTNGTSAHSNWFLTHRPNFGVGQRIGASEPFRAINAPLVSALNGRIARTLKFVLSGHIHLLEDLQFVQTQPMQVIVGASGTRLDAPINEPLQGQIISEVTVRSGRAAVQFGYAIITRGQKQDRITYYSKESKRLWTQELSNH